MNDTIGDAILTCARKPTRVSTLNSCCINDETLKTHIRFLLTIVCVHKLLLYNLHAQLKGYKWKHLATCDNSTH